jgi:hypothetical protein
MEPPTSQTVSTKRISNKDKLPYVGTKPTTLPKPDKKKKTLSDREKKGEKTSLSPQTNTMSGRILWMDHPWTMVTLIIQVMAHLGPFLNNILTNKNVLAHNTLVL